MNDTFANWRKKKKPKKESQCERLTDQSERDLLAVPDPSGNSSRAV